MIEEAFWSGGHAWLPYLQYADERRSDSVAAEAVRANGLEALTLQSNAVQAMLPLNAARALRLFQEIEPPHLTDPGCASAFTPNLDIYFQTAALLFQRAFTAAQRGKGEDELLLQQIIGSLEAPAQVPDAVELLGALKLKAGERRELLALLSARLPNVSRSDREYSGAERELVEAIGRIQASDAALLLPALRAYIVRHAGGRRCSDNLPKGTMDDSAEAFNRLAAKLDPTHSRYQPISPEEGKPSGDDGTYQRTTYGRSEPSQAINGALRWLTHGDRVRDGQPVRWTLAERSTPKWLRRFDDTFELVHDLKESDEPSPEAFFCMKSNALTILASLAPPGDRRDAAMQEYREFLEESYPSIENRNLWFTMVRHMIYTARFSADSEERAWILDELARSPNPVISLYAKIETRFGPPSSSHPIPGVSPHPN
ncbi:MAG TPA: hypothetical protein VLC12_13585 [Terriglobales bacterium]|nr:hypothetical protein [Terriglobales bacterium]